MSATKDDTGPLAIPGSSLSGKLSCTVRSDITVHGRHHWTDKENIELLQYYYSAKAEGKGYIR